MDKKWNLQDIKPTDGTALRNKRSTHKVRNQEPSSSSDTIKVKSTKKKRRVSKGTVTLLSFSVFVIGVFVLVGLLSSQAEVFVTPRSDEVTLSTSYNYLAEKKPDEGGLGYELMSLRGENEATVSATGEEEVSIPASGTLVITNTNNVEQVLIEKTRFESPDGKIYRIADGVRVPGGTSEEPGRLEVTVTAEEAGAEYNVEAGTAFTVPGLKSDPKLYAAIRATNPAEIANGFVGKRLKVADDDLQKVKSDVSEALKEKLLVRASEETPSGFQFFPDSASFVEEVEVKSNGDTEALINVKVTLQIPLFKSEALAKFLATNSIPGYEGLPVRLDSIDDVTFSYTNPDIASNLGNINEFEFNLSGKALLVWEFDEVAFATDLLGVPSSALGQVIKAYPGIKSAKAELRPFWKSSFPPSLSKINITERL